MELERRTGETAALLCDVLGVDVIAPMLLHFAPAPAQHIAALRGVWLKAGQSTISFDTLVTHPAFGRFLARDVSHFETFLKQLQQLYGRGWPPSTLLFSGASGGVEGSPAAQRSRHYLSMYLMSRSDDLLALHSHLIECDRAGAVLLSRFPLRLVETTPIRN
jgi:hypothetical protein